MNIAFVYLCPIIYHVAKRQRIIKIKQLFVGFINYTTLFRDGRFLVDHTSSLSLGG